MGPRLPLGALVAEGFKRGLRLTACGKRLMGAPKVSIGAANVQLGPGAGAGGIARPMFRSWPDVTVAQTF